MSLNIRIKPTPSQYLIVVANRRQPRKGLVIEKLGTFPLHSTKRNQRFVALNIERTLYWLYQGAQLNASVLALFNRIALLDVITKKK